MVESASTGSPLIRMVELDEVAGAVLEEFVVERGVAAADALELVVEVEDDVGEREFVLQVDALGVQVLLVYVDAAPLLAELDQVADVVGRRDDVGLHVRLVDRLDVAIMGISLRLSTFTITVSPSSVTSRPVVDVGHRGDDVEVELAVEALLDDLHVQQAEEADAEAEAQGRGGLRLVRQGGVVELELIERARRSSKSSESVG